MHRRSPSGVSGPIFGADFGRELDVKGSQICAKLLGGLRQLMCREGHGYTKVSHRPKALAKPFLAVLKAIFNFYIRPPLPRGVSGERPDCHFPEEMFVFGPLPARIQREIDFQFLLWP